MSSKGGFPHRYSKPMLTFIGFKLYDSYFEFDCFIYSKVKYPDFSFQYLQNPKQNISLKSNSQQNIQHQNNTPEM